MSVSISCPRVVQGLLPEALIRSMVSEKPHGHPWSNTSTQCREVPLALETLVEVWMALLDHISNQFQAQRYSKTRRCHKPFLGVALFAARQCYKLQQPNSSIVQMPEIDSANLQTLQFSSRHARSPILATAEDWNPPWSILKTCYSHLKVFFKAE